MQGPVAARTKRDQILLYIIAQAAARLDVVNFEAGCLLGRRAYGQSRAAA